jgi:integrase
MTEMRRKGTGSYEHSTKSWRLRTKNIKVSIRQLCRVFGVEIPPNERESLTFWKKYLAQLAPPQEPKLIRSLISEPEPAPIPEALVPILNAAWQMNDPETSEGARRFLLQRLQERICPEIPKKESLKEEAVGYIQTYKAKGGKQHYDINTSISFFLEAAGDIKLSDIDVSHYRAFLTILDREEKERKWTPRTKQNRQRHVHTFLKFLEADHNLVFSFIRNKKYRMEVPPVEQTKYTLEQVKVALANAEGIARTVLLLGLNCGFYASDIIELKPEHFDGTYITKARAKNKRNGVQKGFVGKWKLWPETIAALQYGLKTKDCEREYMKLREKYDLPEAMALRKTVAQWVQELAGEEESRVLYRAEGYGTHYTSYVCNLTPGQVAKLDRALDAVREKILA